MRLKQNEHGRAWLPLGVALVVGIALGYLVATFLSAPDPNIRSWLAKFFISPGFGGSFAVLGAVVAASIAFHNSRQDRIQKERAEDRALWWGQFTWAVERAVDTEPGESELGLLMLMRLIESDLTNSSDNEIVLAVVDVVTDTKQEPKRRNRRGMRKKGRDRNGEI